jgi:hypothetical protein
VVWAACLAPGGEWADNDESGRASFKVVAKELLGLFAPLAAGGEEGAAAALRAWADAPPLPRLGEPLNAGALVAEPAGRAHALAALEREGQEVWYTAPRWATDDASPASTPGT